MRRHVKNGRPHIRVLIESAADRQQQSVQSHVVGHVGMPDRAEQDRIGGPQAVESIRRHHPAVLEVVVCPPVLVRILKLHAEFMGNVIENSQGSGDYFATNTVARYYRDSERGHRKIP